MAFTLPQLPYTFDALEPHIDTTTMQIHHGKHHQTYVNNLNAAIEKAPELAGKSLDDLMRGIDKVPEAVRTAVRNNGGGHWNHSMFWEIMSPGGGSPAGALADAIQDSFGGFDKFKEQWGAKPMQLYWHYWMRNGGPLPELNPRNPKYQLAIRAWKSLPVGFTNLIGPHIVKYLP